MYICMYLTMFVCVSLCMHEYTYMKIYIDKKTCDYSQYKKKVSVLHNNIKIVTNCLKMCQK